MGIGVAEPDTVSWNVDVANLANATAERIADDADMRRGADERREAVLMRSLHDWLPNETGSGANGARFGIDLEGVEAGRHD